MFFFSLDLYLSFFYFTKFPHNTSEHIKNLSWTQKYTAPHSHGETYMVSGIAARKIAKKKKSMCAFEIYCSIEYYQVYWYWFCLRFQCFILFFIPFWIVCFCFVCFQPVLRELWRWIFFFFCFLLRFFSFSVRVCVIRFIWLYIYLAMFVSRLSCYLFGFMYFKYVFGSCKLVFDDKIQIRSIFAARSLNFSVSLFLSVSLPLSIFVPLSFTLSLTLPISIEKCTWLF